MNRVVAIIPARFGSTRFPGKPLADISGKPMVRHVYERAARADLVDHCLVATDDERIASAVRAFGGHAVLTPEDLQTGTDRVAFVARSLPEADIIANVQGDEPLLASEAVTQALRLLVDDPETTVGTLVHRIEHEADLNDPGIVKVVLDNEDNCLYFSRSAIPFVRDDAEDRISQNRYYRHIGLYVYRRDFLLEYPEMRQTPLELAEQLEQLRILEHGHRIKAAVTEYDSFPVDRPEDLDRLRKQLTVIP